MGLLEIFGFLSAAYGYLVELFLPLQGLILVTAGAVIFRIGWVMQKRSKRED